MKVRVAYIVDGQRSCITIKARSTFLALLRLLEMLPDGARVAAVVSVVKHG